MKNLPERIKMVKAMEFIARQINDEELFCDCWLTTGVADGDIEYGDLSVKDDDIETLAYYIEDENFCDLMTLFLRTMGKTYRFNSGLCCDGVVCKTKEDFARG